MPKLWRSKGGEHSRVDATWTAAVLWCARAGCVRCGGRRGALRCASRFPVCESRGFAASAAGRRAPAPASGSGDYYAVLGVRRGAGAAEVRAAFRALALALHPDSRSAQSAAPEAAVKFQMAKEAYDVLGRRESREEYDEALRRIEGAAGARGASGGGDWLGPGMRARVDAARRWREKRAMSASRAEAASAGGAGAASAAESAEADELLQRFRASEKARQRASPRAAAPAAAGRWGVAVPLGAACAAAVAFAFAKRRHEGTQSQRETAS